MRTVRKLWAPCALFSALLWVTLSIGANAAQAAQVRARIATEIDDRVTVPLRGHVRPEVATATRLSPVEQDLPMEHMILTLKADAAQQAALAQLLQDQQNPRSPNYHKFLTPQQFGQQFGTSGADITKITAWLTSHGFTIDQVPAGRQAIVFSGTAAQVSSAFQTTIHKLQSGGELHYANTEEPRIPAALAGVVGGFVRLNDFHHKPAIQSKRVVAMNDTTAPQMTYSTSHYLAPADYATIYNLTPLYASQINGTGQSIAIVARSNISIPDLQAFRSQFGLVANNPAVIIASGTDPGFVSGDGDEATLDVQWSGAVAPNAKVKLVVASSTATADGVDLAAMYIVNNNIAPVMSVSFGSCEAGMGTGGLNFYNALWQQAAAEGITVLVSSGDSGAAGCNSASSSIGSVRAVKGLCSSPYSVCVGGTEFAEGSNPGQYWLPGNNPVMGSAQSYIPETVWNESASNGGSGLWAGGGGASLFFPKPSWQTGAGVPADGTRDVPDVSLTAAGHDGYLIEENGGLYSIAGTSASSPSFAGIMALLNQKVGSRLGAPHSNLYKLAALQNAGGAPVFHDTTAGNNSVPGVTGFAAAPGYDLATGLGSVDATLLINHWTDASAVGTLKATNSPSTLSLAAGASSTFTTNVTAGAAFQSAVTLTASAPAGITVKLSAANLAAPGSGSVTAAVSVANTVTAGTYAITVTAAGGGLVSTAVETITVTAPNFILAASASAVAVNTNGTNTDALTVTPSGGFNSNIALSAAGLPAGVTASFSPSMLSAGGTSTLTLSAAQTARPGTYAVTITASGRGLTKIVTLGLTVVAPSFTVTATALPGTLPTGGRTTATLSVTPAGGFKAAVSFSTSGLPSGVTVAFSPATLSISALARTTATFSAGPAAKPGTYSVTINATGGGITHAIPLTLTVKSASLKHPSIIGHYSRLGDGARSAFLHVNLASPSEKLTLSANSNAAPGV